MKAKTIKAVLNKKFKDWADSIDDPKVKELVLKNTIITGGCIASMLLKEKVNDFDVYFRNLETAKKVAEYYIDKFDAKPNQLIRLDDAADKVKIIIQDSGIAEDEDEVETLMPEEAATYQDEVVDRVDDDFGMDEKEKPVEEPYLPVFLSSNAITLTNKIQIIVRFFGEPDEIHENYDFIHCTNYWDSKTRALTLRPAAIEAILTKELRYVGSKFPLSSIIRTRKFIQRQWTINAGQYLKMAMQLNELDLTDVDVLEDQLIGVDVAYFNQVIRRMREKGQKIETTYLYEIVDRLF